MHNILADSGIRMRIRHIDYLISTGILPVSVSEGQRGMIERVHQIDAVHNTKGAIMNVKRTIGSTRKIERSLVYNS